MGSGSPYPDGRPPGRSERRRECVGQTAPARRRGLGTRVPDRPGHARSPSRGPESIERDAGWVAEMLGDGMHLVGHSYGGCIATEAAGLRPEAVRSLTVVEAAAASVAPDHPAVVANRQAMVTALIAAATPRERYLGVRALRGDSAGHVREPGRGPRKPAWARGCSSCRRRPSGTRGRHHDDRRRGNPVPTVTGGWSGRMAAIADALAAQLTEATSCWRPDITSRSSIPTSIGQ